MMMMMMIMMMIMMIMVMMFLVGAYGYHRFPVVGQNIASRAAPADRAGLLQLSAFGLLDSFNFPQPSPILNSTIKDTRLTCI